MPRSATSRSYWRRRLNMTDRPETTKEQPALDGRDVVNRLRAEAHLWDEPSSPIDWRVLRDGADEIERLRARVASLYIEAIAMVREVEASAGEPTPLHKGIRMACASIIDRLEQRA